MILAGLISGALNKMCALYNLGSVATIVLTRVDNVPTNISGELISIANETRQTINEYTGIDPGSIDITLKFQPAMINMTISETLGLMQLEGADVASIKLGDFSESKGSASNISNAIDYFDKKADKAINNIGRKSRYNRTW